MVSIRSSVFLVAATSALALHGHTDAAACDADNYSKVAAAVQTLHSNCASWAAYLASGGVWTCDSTCRDAVANLVDTLPDCTFGGPYGQNYKQVVEGMVATCNGAVSAGSDSTAAPSSTTAAPSDSTAVPSSTTAAPSVNTSSSNNNNTTESATPTTTTAPSTTTSTDNKDATDKDSSASSSTSASAGAADTPASDVATTSGASLQTASAMTALVLVVVGSLLNLLLHCEVRL